NKRVSKLLFYSSFDWFEFLCVPLTMTKLWTFLSALHSIAGPVVMLLYPLYASVLAIESPSKADDEQWLAYWIIYSFLTLSELILQSLLEWIPIWYTAKLVLVAWLVLPQFRGAAFIYNRVVREQFRKYGILKPKVNYFIFNHFPIFL
ncbi:unnamed protein product, partial [Brassica oleracea var. botrytis]